MSRRLEALEIDLSRMRGLVCSLFGLGGGGYVSCVLLFLFTGYANLPVLRKKVDFTGRRRQAELPNWGSLPPYSMEEGSKKGVLPVVGFIGSSFDSPPWS